MCVIIVKQKDKPLSREVAKTSARKNPHGLGIVWLDTFEVTRHESKEYGVLTSDENKHRPFIAHFRYATVGKISKENTHPFVCGAQTDELLMMNGTAAGYGNKKMTDSQALANELGTIPRKDWKQHLMVKDVNAPNFCRFVSINTRTRSFQIYNRELFTYHDGVWFSKANVLETNVIAVYGTLKKGYSNYYHYLTGSKYVGGGKTKNKYPLIKDGLPYVVNKPGIGHNIEVDVFKVSDQTFENIDSLEGHPIWYKREQITIMVKGKEVVCWLYFNPTIELKPHHKFLKTYTQDYRPYKGYSFNSKSTYTKTYRKPVTKPAVTRIADLFDDCNADDTGTGFNALKECSDSKCNTKNFAFDGWGNYYCETCGEWYT
jgi:gamma-glutamylaminecyclotransferase